MPKRECQYCKCWFDSETRFRRVCDNCRVKNLAKRTAEAKRRNRKIMFK